MARRIIRTDVRNLLAQFESSFCSCKPKMNNKRVLYNLEISPPARAVRVVAKLIGLELELRDVDMFGGEHLSETYVKMNPEHTIPTLDDNGFIIWESHAICAYLVDKYAKDDKLYPKDLQLRAKCNQRLFFEASSLFVRLRDIGIPIYRGECTEVPQDKIDTVKSALDILEAFLASDPFLVGANLTIADASVAITVPFLGIYVSLEKYPKIVAWQKRVSEAIPFFDEMNAKYTEQYRQLIHSTIEKNKQSK